MPLPDGSLGNPADIVELRADLVLASITSKDLGDRVDWWLEEGGDECVPLLGTLSDFSPASSVFIFDQSAALPEDFVSFTRLLLLSQSEWEKVKIKGKLPKPRMDDNIADIAEKTIRCRLDQYPTTLDVSDYTHDHTIRVILLEIVGGRSYAFRSAVYDAQVPCHCRANG